MKSFSEIVTAEKIETKSLKISSYFCNGSKLASALGAVLTPDAGGSKHTARTDAVAVVYPGGAANTLCS